MKTKKITTRALTVALAMILSYVESQIPPLTMIPGIKLGLANIAVVFTLYAAGGKEAVAVSVLRVFLVSLLFGSAASLMYSAAGAVLSLAGMLLLKRSGRFSVAAVSVAGGVLHNTGQIIMACILLGTDAVFYYLPFLVLSGIISGVGIGLLSALLVNRIKL